MAQPLDTVLNTRAWTQHQMATHPDQATYKRSDRKEEESPAWKRHQRINIAFQEGQIDDLREIASAWETDPATVAWVIIAEILAGMRNRKLSELPNSKKVQRALRAAGLDVEEE